MSKDVLRKIVGKYKYKVDLMIGGYSGAGPYPQCFKNLNRTKKLKSFGEKNTILLKAQVS